MAEDAEKQWRFLVSTRIRVGEDLTLPPDQSHHLADVLRLSEGRRVRLFTGGGEEFEGVVRSADPEASIVRVRRRVRSEDAAGVAVTLGFAPPRGARADWLVEKATELGARRLIPLLCERLERFPVERARKRRERWERKAEEAARQSGRTVIPAIEEPVPPGQFAGSCGAPLRLACHAGSGVPGLWGALRGMDQVPAAAALAIGPGGGFTDRELAQLNRSGWQFVSLGPTTLRTETACVVALGCLSVRGEQGEG